MKLQKTKDNEIYFYYLKSGERRYLFRHKYVNVLGKRKEKKKSGFKTEKDALRALLEVKAAILNGQTNYVENSQMTVSRWLDIWYETYSDGWEVTSRKQRLDAIKHQMKPLLGEYKLKDLDRTTYVREFIKPLMKDYKPRTVDLFHTLFKIAINAAVEDEIIIRNRFSKVTVDRDEALDNFLTPEELNKFLYVTKKYENITNYTFVLLLAYTGLRKGEALGLKWKNVNLKKNSITVDCTRDRLGDRTPKTKNSYRTIPIDDVLANQLKFYQKWCIKTKLSFGLKVDKREDYVLTSYQGGTPLGANTSLYLFKRIYQNLKKEDIEIKRITPHGLRHTHATTLINAGVPPKTIADRLGNTVEMLFRIYTHSNEELESWAVSAFNESMLSGAKFGAK